ncbi:hypothetical protein TPY_2717 [Sulfobacillus acidophilus TPY]|uniref:Uncharacterized protein n=1 Tax=Sulfobacillus acidophilus (strain ATCC 700253 / DSM 10332 / NAL) TaxID=679936 RepID=G8TUL6_SULAD|nr:hypothetical protein TPY_2717 [Sulfobacillus acidophilus TPY]AEW04663.1 hypothetical protein Sulac_1163 [Sulfobacillus acidophilus DSM 10332]
MASREPSEQRVNRWRRQLTRWRWAVDGLSRRRVRLYPAPPVLGRSVQFFVECREDRQLVWSHGPWSLDTAIAAAIEFLQNPNLDDLER